MILNQYRAVLVNTWLYWVSRGRCWLVLGGTGSLHRAVLGFILESLIVGRFVDFCWEICSFLLEDL